MTTALAKCGFTYDTLLRRKSDGGLISAASARNRVPTEGLNAIAEAFFKAGGVPSALHIGLWTGAHVPDGTETAATLLSVVTEVTAYDGSTRKAFLPGAVANGGLSNAADVATFNFNADASVNGAFISTAPAKGSGAGQLLSLVRFPAVRNVDNTVYLEILSGFQFVSM